MFKPDHLRSFFRGEIIQDPSILDYYSHDGSIFEIKPQGVLIPRDVKDLRALMEELWQQNSRGDLLCVTPRGYGTDQTGSAIGPGIIISFPEHFGNINEIGSTTVQVEPGADFAKLNEVLIKMKHWIPLERQAMNQGSVGGMIANNAAGSQTIKYGQIRQHVKKLKVVLANGELIETRPLSHQELETKKTQLNLEGDIYRAVADAVAKNRALLYRERPRTSNNASGYALWDVEKYSTFDLSQIFIGSEGTLGLIVEAELSFTRLPRYTAVLVGCFNNAIKLSKAVQMLLRRDPSALKLIDQRSLNIARKDFKGLIAKDLPKFILVVEFDGDDRNDLQNILYNSGLLFKSFAYEVEPLINKDDQQALWRAINLIPSAARKIGNNLAALPLIEDCSVPTAHLTRFLQEIDKILDKLEIEAAIWGDVGTGSLQIRPIMDLGILQSREKIFHLQEKAFDLTVRLGGTLASEHGDGLLRALWLHKKFSPQMVDLFWRVKKACDPYNMLNPWVKLGATSEYLKQHLRQDF